MLQAIWKRMKIFKVFVLLLLVMEARPVCRSCEGNTVVLEYGSDGSVPQQVTIRRGTWANFICSDPNSAISRGRFLVNGVPIDSQGSLSTFINVWIRINESHDGATVQCEATLDNSCGPCFSNSITINVTDIPISTITSRPLPITTAMTESSQSPTSEVTADMEPIKEATPTTTTNSTVATEFPNYGMYIGIGISVSVAAVLLMGFVAVCCIGVHYKCVKSWKRRVCLHSDSCSNSPHILDRRSTGGGTAVCMSCVLVNIDDNSVNGTAQAVLSKTSGTLQDTGTVQEKSGLQTMESAGTIEKNVEYPQNADVSPANDFGETIKEDTMKPDTSIQHGIQVQAENTVKEGVVDTQNCDNVLDDQDEGGIKKSDTVGHKNVDTANNLGDSGRDDGCDKAQFKGVMESSVDHKERVVFDKSKSDVNSAPAGSQFAFGETSRQRPEDMACPTPPPLVSVSTPQDQSSGPGNAAITACEKVLHPRTSPKGAAFRSDVKSVADLTSESSNKCSGTEASDVSQASHEATGSSDVSGHDGTGAVKDDCGVNPDGAIGSSTFPPGSRDMTQNHNTEKGPLVFGALSENR